MYTPAVYHMCTTLISAVCRDIFCRPQRCSDAFASRKALLKRFDLQFYFPAAVWSHQTYSCPQTNGAGSLWSSSYVSYITMVEDSVLQYLTCMLLQTNREDPQPINIDPTLCHAEIHWHWDLGWQSSGCFALSFWQQRLNTLAQSIQTQPYSSIIVLTFYSQLEYNLTTITPKSRLSAAFLCA